MEFFNTKSKNKEVCYAILTFSVVGLIICILSIMMAGSLQRYIIDYGWMLILARNNVIC